MHTINHQRLMRLTIGIMINGNEKLHQGGNNLNGKTLYL